MAVALQTNHFRFGGDELTEATHGFLGAEDTSPSPGVIGLDTTFLLRFNVQATGGGAGVNNVDNQFQYSLNGNPFISITSSSSVVRAVTSVALTEGGNCTKRLSGTGTFESSGAGQTVDGLSGGNNNDIVGNGCSETECALQILSASVAQGDVITFRLTSPDATITNNVVPTIRIPHTKSPGVASPSLSLAGVAAGLLLTLIPGTGSLTVAGATPTYAHTIQSTAGSLTLAGVAGTLQASLTPGTQILRLGIQSANTPLTPTTGALALAGAAPPMSKGIPPASGALVLEGRTQGSTSQIQPATAALKLGLISNQLTPGTAALVLEGHAFAGGSQLTPDTAALKLGLLAGGSSQRTPSPAGLALLGYAPTLTEVSVNITFLTPGTGAAFIGDDNDYATPLTGTLDLVGVSATTRVTETPATVALAFASEAPQLLRTLFPAEVGLVLAGRVSLLETTVTPQTGAALLAGLPPTATDDKPPDTVDLVPGAGALALGGALPTLSPTLTITVQPPAGELVFASDPSELELALTPGTGALVLEGIGPTDHRTLTPGTGALALHGQAPVDPTAGGARSRRWLLPPWKIPIGPTHVQVV